MGQEALSVRTRRNAEVSFDAGPYVAEALPYADASRANAGTEGKHRHALARVLRAAPSRVAAMVGGQDHYVAIAQFGG
jgi:uncharacterized membrane-anchored protein